VCQHNGIKDATLLHVPTPLAEICLKLTSIPLAKNFPALYDTRRFTAAFISACPGPKLQPDEYRPHRYIYYFLKIRFNIPSTSWSSKWSLTLQNFTLKCFSSFPCVLHAQPISSLSSRAASEQEHNYDAVRVHRAVSFALRKPQTVIASLYHVAFTYIIFWEWALLTSWPSG
jgi:hypothetical protein